MIPLQTNHHVNKIKTTKVLLVNVICRVEEVFAFVFSAPTIVAAHVCSTSSYDILS